MVKKRPKASCALAAAKRLAARADAENIHPQQAWIDSARTKPVALPACPRLVRVLRILGAGRPEDSIGQKHHHPAEQQCGDP